MKDFSKFAVLLIINMNKNLTQMLLAGGLLMVFAYSGTDVIAQSCTPPPVGCTGTDFSNSFLNSTVPATIEYDNVVSTFHSTMARQSDGTVLVWGELMGSDGTSNILTAQELNSTNYTALTGQVLKFTGASADINTSQFAVLTTTGLFVWGHGTLGSLVPTGVKNTASFQKIGVGGKADGLPPGVSPTDVKMLFGTFRALVITTCDGNVWVLSSTPQHYGDGSVSTSNLWHRVRTNETGNPFLTNVVATRGSRGFLMALRADGTVWTWGATTFLGNGTAATSRFYATQMDLPAGITVKQIGGFGNATAVSYYLLSTAGHVYALGHNQKRGLGDFTTDDRTSWIRVQQSATTGDYLSNVAWISPSEHDGSSSIDAAINALTQGGTLWAWGAESSYRLGIASTSATGVDPAVSPGGLAITDKIMAVETGGHTSIVIKECSGRFGYVGHRINGSMADGIVVSGQENTYNFSETSVLNICGAPSGAATLFPVAGNTIISPNSIQLSYSPAGGTFAVTGPATVSATGLLTANGLGNITVTYNYNGTCGSTTSSISLTSTANLPVTFDDLQASIDRGRFTVNWHTLSETNNDHFEIEVSVDGKTFIKAGEIKSKAEGGNSSEVIAYTFVSEWPSSAILGAGIGVLLMGCLGTPLSRRQRKLVLAAIAGIVIAVAGCNKSNKELPEIGADLYVRVVQVDIDGAKSYSKLVKAVAE